MYLKTKKISLLLMLVVFSTLSAISQEIRMVVNKGVIGYVAPKTPYYIPSNTNYSSYFSSSGALKADAGVKLVPGAAIPELSLGAGGSLIIKWVMESGKIRVNAVEIKCGDKLEFYRQTNAWGGKGWVYISNVGNVPSSRTANGKYGTEGKDALYVLCRYTSSTYGSIFVYVDRYNLCNPSTDNCRCNQ